MERPKVLLTRQWPAEVERYLADRYDLTTNPDDKPLDAQQLTEAMAKFDAVCPTVSDALPAEVIGTGTGRARIIGNFGVGFNHIDLAACRTAGIVVTNTPDVLTETTAELALLLMLTVARRAGEGERELRAGRWAGWRPTHLLGTSLSGRTLGLVGFGRIAQATARRARAALGMTIFYHQRRRAAPEVETELAAEWCASLDELVARADVVSLHCPGGAETHHLLDATRLARMKPGAILINTARGTVVDEAALAQALAAGTIGGAGLDVYEREPEVHPALLALDNVVLLPHLGSATVETRVAMGMRVAENLELFFAGQTPRDHVA